MKANYRVRLYSEIDFDYRVKEDCILIDSMTDVIAASFIFSDTPERKEFWYDIVDELRGEI